MGKNYFNTSGEGSEAEFNLAMGTILRIDANLKEVNHFLKLHDYKGAFETLQTLYSEISPFLNSKEEQENDQTELELSRDLKLSSVYNPKTRKTMFVSKNNVALRIRKWDRSMRKLMLKGW